MIEWIKDKKYHFMVWTIFIFYESIILGFYSGNFAKFENYAIHYIINIFFFYLNAHFTLPKAFLHRKARILRMLFFVVLELSFYLLVIITVDSFLLRYTNILNITKIDTHYYLGGIFRGLYFIGFSSGYFFLIKYNEENRRADELEKLRLTNIIKEQQIEQELQKSKNAYLRAQINPHFFFNTLDFIYQDTRKLAPQAAEAIIALSDIMRYAVDSNFEGDFIHIADELEQIENLIQIHKLKSSRELHIDLNYGEEVKELRLIPLVLLTLVENMFKHGNLKEADHPAHIDIFIKDDVLYVETSNLIQKAPQARGLNSGMNNISKRLQYTYGDTARFHYSRDKQNYYKVTLTIKSPFYFPSLSISPSETDK